MKERLGRGGIGAVHRCLDTQMGRDVAIKRLLPIEQTELNEPATDSLQREATALAAFQHPNVVTVFEFSEDEKGPFVVTELIEGGNLKTAVKANGPLELRDFYSLVDQTLDVLIAAKELNLLHRDLKPANIMMRWLPSGKFHAKILDFGLSKFILQASKQTVDVTGSFLGSIDYCSPEQFKRRLLDHRTDLYSIACVYYFCLTGKSPFGADGAKATMKKHLNHDVVHVCDRRKDLPEAVGDWLMHLMSRWPEDRPGNAAEALRGFEMAHDRGMAPMGFNFVPMKPGAYTEPAIEVTPRPEQVKTPVSHALPSKRIPTTGPLSAPVTQPIRITKPTGARDATGTTGAENPQKTKSRPVKKNGSLILLLIGLGMALIFLIGGLAIVFGDFKQNKKPQPQWMAQPTIVIEAPESNELLKARTSPENAKISDRTTAGEKP